MTILADFEIRKLCTPPTFMVTERINSFLAGETENWGINCLPKTITYLTQLTEDELMLTKQSVDHSDTGIVFYRKLTDKEIADYKPMISPYVEKQIKVDENGNRTLSYGQSSMGYDVRLADEFKIFTNIRSTMIDPLDFDQDCLVDHKGPFVIIPPNSYILGRTVETFNIPKDILVLCVGKSTMARAGAIVNVTPIEPGFIGVVVIEISNSTSLPLKVYANAGIAQFLFMKASGPCEVSYGDRSGKYMHQIDVQTPLV